MTAITNIASKNSWRIVLRKTLSGKLNVNSLELLTSQQSFFLYCLMCQNDKKRQNTDFGYKKRSKWDLNIGSESATSDCVWTYSPLFSQSDRSIEKLRGWGKPKPLSLRLLKWQFDSAFRGLLNEKSIWFFGRIMYDAKKWENIVLDCKKRRKSNEDIGLRVSTCKFMWESPSASLFYIQK